MMGCILSLFSRSKTDLHTRDEPKQSPTKEYSWDKQRRLDPAHYTIEGKSDAVLGRIPGQINGQQFIVQDCKNCCIYLFDYIATITVDECENCKFFIGPVKTSIFIRNCKDCSFIVSCQQLRTRDCHKMDVFLACVSKPIIESSSRVTFAPYRYFYPQLEEQFRNAGLSPFNCIWSDIHDFTPMEECNYALMSESAAARPQNFVPLPGDASDTHPHGDYDEGETPFPSTALLSVEVDLNEQLSVVMTTHGKRRWSSDMELCLVLLFDLNEGPNMVAKRARRIVAQVKGEEDAGDSETALLSTSESHMDEDDVKRIIGDNNGCPPQFKAGSVVSLVLSGNRILQRCASVCSSLLQLRSHCLYHSSDHGQAQQQIDKLNSFWNMQMNTQ